MGPVNYPTEKNPHIYIDESGVIDDVNATSAGNDFWQESKSSRDLYNTQVGKFLTGGKRSNLMTGKNKIVNGMDDPSFLAFSFGITNVDQAGLFGDDITLDNPNNMLLALNKDRSYSALSYLKNAIGNPDGENEGKRQMFPTEYVELKKFVDGFKEITINHPYVFQTIEGLTEAYKLYINMHKDSMLGGGKETKIKITCLESMDLRMAALFDSYFQSVYNHQYRRMNIPNNLLRFDCWVLLHDMRNIAQDVTELMGAIRSNSPKVTKGIISHLSTVLFLFKNCTFNVEEIGSTFDSISNKDNNETKFTFTFNYGDIDVGINSLADVFENNALENAADNVYEFATDIIRLNDDALLKRSPTKNFDDDMYDPNYGIGLDIGGTLKKLGTKIFNYATGNGGLGNIYDESWAGMLSNMMSTISNASTSSIINSVFNIGKQHTINALNNKFNPNQEQKRELGDIDLGINDSVYGQQGGRGARPGSLRQQNQQEQIPDLGSVDMNASAETGQLSSYNIYGNIVFLQESPSGNVYGSIPPQQATQLNEHIDMHASQPTQPSGSIDLTASPANHLNSINVYQISPPNQSSPTGNVYGNTPISQPYHGEMTDMTDNSNTGILDPESIDMTTPKPSTLEEENVYNTVTISGKSSKAQFHINVYDRIVESITNPMPIEKIFDTPRQPQKLQKENVFPLIRESGTNKTNHENVYPKIQEQKINFGNENVYKK